MAQPHNDETAASAGASDAIQAIRTLVDARDIRAAKQQLRRNQAHFDDPTWAIVGEIANTLRYKTHDVAITKLRKLWRDNEQHRALIEACAPKTDDGQYIPDNQPAAGRQTDGPRRPPGRVVRRVDPAQRTNPRQRTGSAAAGRVDAYEDQLDAEERREQGTPRPELIVDRRDYDRDAAAEVTEPLCVSCRLERACIDRWTGQITTGHGDDGLCGTCREERRQGIPKLPLGHSRSQAIQARLDTIATNFDSHTPALFRHEWRYGNALTKDITVAWVTQHNPDARVTPTATAESVDFNGECIECGDRRQLRDELCVDCHAGLNGNVVIAGTLDPLTVKGTLKAVIDDDAMAAGQTRPAEDTATASNDRYRAEFMHRLNVGRRNEDDPIAASPQDRSQALALGGAQRQEGSGSQGIDKPGLRADASSLNSEQRAQNPAVAIPSDPTNVVTEPGKDPGVRRRQQLRNRATMGRVSRGQRI